MTKVIEIQLKDAKENLSKYVNRVAAGNKFVVTKHGKPVADIIQHVDSQDEKRERTRLAVLGLRKLSANSKTTSNKKLKEMMTTGRDK